MTPKKLAQCFEVYAGLVSNPLIAQGINELAVALHGIKAPKGILFTEHLRKLLSSSSGEVAQLSLGEIIDEIAPLHQLLVLASTNASQLQINRFFSLLQEYRDMSIATFLSRIGLGADQATTAARDYIEEFQCSIADAERFSSLIKRLRSDKSLSPDDISMIASAVTGLKKKWTRKGAVDALIAKQEAYFKATHSFLGSRGKSAA